MYTAADLLDGFAAAAHRFDVKAVHLQQGLQIFPYAGFVFHNQDLLSNRHDIVLSRNCQTRSRAVFTRFSCLPVLLSLAQSAAENETCCPSWIRSPPRFFPDGPAPGAWRSPAPGPFLKCCGPRERSPQKSPGGAPEGSPARNPPRPLPRCSAAASGTFGVPGWAQLQRLGVPKSKARRSA